MGSTCFSRPAFSRWPIAWRCSCVKVSLRRFWPPHGVNKSAVGPQMPRERVADHRFAPAELGQVHGRPLGLDGLEPPGRSRVKGADGSGDNRSRQGDRMRVYRGSPGIRPRCSRQAIPAPSRPDRPPGYRTSAPASDCPWRSSVAHSSHAVFNGRALQRAD